MLRMKVMTKWIFCFSVFLLVLNQSLAQCNLAYDAIDEFDSTRLVLAEPVNIGYLIPSLYEEVEGPKMIEEGKVVFSYAESEDSIVSFFLTLALPEYDFLQIDQGETVMLSLGDSMIVRLYNFPDKGVFDKNTNMRLYQHTCLVSINNFYKLLYFDVTKIRVRYRTKKRTIELSAAQQEAFKNSVRCVAEALDLLPLRP